jgi:hypothetical protein
MKMNDNLNKPISIVRAEFISDLTNLINQSSLPLFVIEPILKDIYIEVKNVMQKQYEQDLLIYNQSKQAQLNNDDEKLNKE